MHEHGVGDLILHDLEHYFPTVPAGGCLRVRARVSEISGLTSEALQAALDHAHEQHEAPPIRLEVLTEGLLGRCRDCGTVTPVSEDLVCGACGSGEVTLCGGETVLIEEVSVCSAGEPTGG